MNSTQVLPEPFAGVHLKAAAWILSLVCRRGRSIAQADKPVLIALWSAGADYSHEGDCPARKTWISRADLAQRVGATLDAVADSLKRLARHGWVRRIGRGWALAWRIPFTERAQGATGPGAPTLARADAGASCLDETPVPRVQAPVQLDTARVQAPDPRVQARANQINQKSELTTNEIMNLSRDDADTSPDVLPDLAVESRSTPRDRSNMKPPKGQGSLFDSSVTIPPQKPARCLADVVFQHLRERIIQTKADLGIKPATGPRVLDNRQRKAILARIDEHGGGDEGVEACKRVIAVDEADCRRQGPRGPSWNYWNASTPFRNPANFEGRFGRWREDGDHAVFGVHGGSSTRGGNIGFQPAQTEEDEAELWAATSEGYDT